MSASNMAATSVKALSDTLFKRPVRVNTFSLKSTKSV